MANVFEYASVFQSELDKAAVEQATSGWMELNDKLVRASFMTGMWAVPPAMSREPF